jgi:hypothetical protein
MKTQQSKVLKFVAFIAKALQEQLRESFYNWAKKTYL